MKLAEEMDILERTNEEFQEGTRVKVIRMESLSTMWVRIRGWPSIMRLLNSEMSSNHLSYVPEEDSLRPGMLVATEVFFKKDVLWERAIVQEQTSIGYNVLLIDWGLLIHQSFSSIRLLPERFKTMAPWARKIRLRGVRDQEEQTMNHHVAKLITLRKRSGNLFNIDTSPGEAMTARLVLDWREGEEPRDVGAYWLQLGYLDPE